MWHRILKRMCLGKPGLKGETVMTRQLTAIIEREDEGGLRRPRCPDALDIASPQGATVAEARANR